MTPIISSGTTLAISAALPTTIDRTGFEALTFTQIRGVRSAGDLGTQHQLVASNPIGKAFSSQRRVGRIAGTVPLELIRIADAGQAMLAAAANARQPYSYRITRPDGSRLYFTAAASSRIHGGFSSASLADTKCALEISSVIVEVD